jgi:hypothetical protein
LLNANAQFKVLDGEVTITALPPPRRGAEVGGRYEKSPGIAPLKPIQLGVTPAVVSQAVFLMEEVVGRALVGVMSEANKLGSRTEENRQRGLWQYPPPGPWMVLVNPDQRERYAVSFKPSKPVVESVGIPGSDEGTEYRNTDHSSTGRSNFTKASSAQWRFTQIASRVGSWSAGNERNSLWAVGARKEFDKGSEALVSPGRIG